MDLESGDAKMLLSKGNPSSSTRSMRYDDIEHSIAAVTDDKSNYYDNIESDDKSPASKNSNNTNFLIGSLLSFGRSLSSPS